MAHIQANLALQLLEFCQFYPFKAPAGRSHVTPKTKTKCGRNKMVQDFDVQTLKYNNNNYNYNNNNNNHKV